MKPLLLGTWIAAMGWCCGQEPLMEKLVLFGGDSAKTWSPAESMVTPSAERVKVGKASLHWHVTVDFYGGEKNYPIGWPRFSHAIPEGPQRDWSGWDYLSMWVYTETSREALPREPVGLGLYMPDRSSAYSRSLNELKKGEWVEIRIPIAQIPRHHDVRSMQFHIAESRYRHGDTLDLYVDDIALLRYARPTLLEFAAENAVMFAGGRNVPVSFRLAGVKPGRSAEVACELKRDGRIAARTTMRAERGEQRVTLDAGRGKLAPGYYEIVATVAGNPQPATARLRLVESPWR
ncbi:MAG: hypothetical protein N2689_09775 [Verrucomicrobiae bacterium]|nr:hypothetical protein [Verrucomicrobiae bacterium]